MHIKTSLYLRSSCGFLSRINRLEVLDLSVDEQTAEALDLATPNEVNISEGTQESLATADDTALTGTKICQVQKLIKA